MSSETRSGASTPSVQQQQLPAYMQLNNQVPSSSAIHYPSYLDTAEDFGFHASPTSASSSASSSNGKPAIIKMGSNLAPMGDMDYPYVGMPEHDTLSSLSVPSEDELYRSVTVDTYTYYNASPYVNNSAHDTNFYDSELATTHANNMKDASSFIDTFNASLSFGFVEPSIEAAARASDAPLAPCGYLEPNCHFFVNSLPTETLNNLLKLLQAKGVDCDLQLDSYRIVCEAYRECSRVEFTVRVFSATEGQRRRGAYAVEFQRRFGDGMAFYSLYADIMRKFGDASSTVISSASSSPTSRLRRARTYSPSPLACPPLDLPDMRCCQQQQEDVLRSLVAMCDTDCVDVKAQALIALAEMTSNCSPEMKAAMMRNGVVTIFTRSLGCTYTDVHRCAVTGLANLMSCRQNEPLCDGLLKDAEAREALVHLIRTGCPQVVRECARSFALLVDTMKDQVKDDSCVQSCVQALLAAPDSTVRDLAENVRQKLQDS